VAYLDTTRLQADTGFKPQYSLDRAVADYVSWLQQTGTSDETHL
jgi:UDP-glucose 4-epimerase